MSHEPSDQKPIQPAQNDRQPAPDQPIDLRIQRTHKFLQEAIIELIAEKGFDAITVGDIAERAMINRATFYRHYEDKYDLVAKIFEETVNQLMRDKQPFNRENQSDSLERAPQIWISFFEHIAEHGPLYRAMLGKSGSSWFAARMRDHIGKIMLEGEKLYDQYGQAIPPIEPMMPADLALMQLSQALIGTIIWWLESDMRHTPYQLATWFHRVPFFGYLAARGFMILEPHKGQMRPTSVETIDEVRTGDPVR